MGGCDGAGGFSGKPIMMEDHGIFSWTSRAEKSEGADGREVRNPDQWIGGLTDSKGPCLRKGLCTAELGHV